MTLTKGQKLYHRYGSETRLTQITSLFRENGVEMVKFKRAFTILARLPFWTPLSWYGPFFQDKDRFVAGIQQAGEPQSLDKLEY